LEVVDNRVQLEQIDSMMLHYFYRHQKRVIPSLPGQGERRNGKRSRIMMAAFMRSPCLGLHPIGPVERLLVESDLRLPTPGVFREDRLP
jgi:hypothetical protein